MENIPYFKLSDILLALYLRYAKEKGGGIEKYLAYRLVYHAFLSATSVRYNEKCE